MDFFLSNHRQQEPWIPGDIQGLNMHSFQPWMISSRLIPCFLSYSSPCSPSIPPQNKYTLCMCIFSPSLSPCYIYSPMVRIHVCGTWYEYILYTCTSSQCCLTKLGNRIQWLLESRKIVLMDKKAQGTSWAKALISLFSFAISLEQSKEKIFLISFSWGNLALKFSEILTCSLCMLRFFPQNTCFFKITSLFHCIPK